jgi:hypothetical protein
VKTLREQLEDVEVEYVQLEQLRTLLDKPLFIRIVDNPDEIKDRFERMADKIKRLRSRIKTIALITPGDLDYESARIEDDIDPDL